MRKIYIPTPFFQACLQIIAILITIKTWIWFQIIFYKIYIDFKKHYAPANCNIYFEGNEKERKSKKKEKQKKEIRKKKKKLTEKSLQ